MALPYGDTGPESDKKRDFALINFVLVVAALAVAAMALYFR
jgi:hypothetical protein